MPRHHDQLALELQGRQTTLGRWNIQHCPAESTCSQGGDAGTVSESILSMGARVESSARLLRLGGVDWPPGRH